MADPRTAGRTPALIGLILLPLLLLAPSLFGDRALVGVHTGGLSPWRAELPADLAARAAAESLALYADKTIQFQPLLALSLERLAEGQLPLWNPDNLGGVPLLAQAFQGAFYPPCWLALVLPWARAFAWIAWLQAALAGLFAALLARELGRGWGGAFLAGTSFMLCGYLSARWHWYQIQGCSVWLPLVIWSLERQLRTAREPASDGPGVRWLALTAAALAVACSLLTGWIQGAVHALYLGGLWGLARFVPLVRAGGETRRRGLGAATRCAAGLALGLALAAPQLLPTLEYVGGGGSARAVEPPSVVRSVAMDPVGLGALLLPDLFGHPRDLARHPEPQLRTAGALRRALYDPADNDNFVEGAASIGLAALLLALLGAALAHRGRGPALACLVAGPLLALDTPLLEVVARLPGLASGDPQRFLLLSSLGGALLAGAAWDHLAGGGRAPRWTRLVAGLAGLALLTWLATRLLLDEAGWADWLAGRLSWTMGLSPQDVLDRSEVLAFDLALLRTSLLRAALVLLASVSALTLLRQGWRPALALLLLITVGDQALTGWRNATTVPAARLFEAPPGLEALRGSGDGRLVRVDPQGTAAGLTLPLPPNTGTPHRIPDLGGYWALAPRRMVALFEALEPGSTGGGLGLAALRPELLDHPALDVLAVDQVLTGPDLRLDRGVVTDEPPRPVGDALLWRRPDARPRAWFTTAEPVADEAAALEAVVGRGWDPAGPAPVEPLADQQPPSQDPWPADLPRPSVQRREHAPEHIQLAVDTPRDGLLVLADTWSPGWEATLDGRPVPVFPAFHALRAVVVPTGAHTVQLRYRSPALGAGASAAAIALLALLLSGVRALRQR